MGHSESTLDNVWSSKFWKPKPQIKLYNFKLEVSSKNLKMYKIALFATACTLAAEGLLLAEISRGRGRRAAEEPIMKLDPLFDSIAAVDVADCGKLLVCHVSAQPQESLSVDESRIARFFQQYKGKVDPLHAQAQYMLAAQTGSYKRPEICQRQYVKCPYPADKLGDLLKA